MRKAAHNMWRRCWRGKIPQRRRILIYDSNEHVTLVNSCRDRFFEHWLGKTGARVLFYHAVDEVPFSTLQLWPEPETEPKGTGNTNDPLVDHPLLPQLAA